jgi:hypothetical protein
MASDIDPAQPAETPPIIAPTLVPAPAVNEPATIAPASAPATASPASVPTTSLPPSSFHHFETAPRILSQVSPIGAHALSHQLFVFMG